MISKRGFVMRVPFSLLLIVVLAQGCKDRDESLVKEFLKRPVSGMVDGDEWEVKYAYIDPTAKTPKEDDYAFILLNYKPEKPCPKITSIPQGAVTAMVSAPQQKSKRALRLKSGTARSLVFQWQKDKKPFAIVAKTGRFQIISSS